MKTGIRLFLTAALMLLIAPGASAQEAPPKHEFRGSWISTVANLDWPRSRTAGTAQQKENLAQILDELKAAGVNAVFFQVRTEADALYASDLEPWSYWLTGAQGQAPEPFYDPLQFAVEEAHRRGMELHAWFNPFRARRAASDYGKAPGHVTQEHPEWLLSFDDGSEILNPGLPEVRDYVTSVVMDVVQRYDVDGVHFDDYFYPYPPNQMDQEGNRTKDQAAFEANPRGFTDIENWRRDNVNTFVAQVHDALQTEAPSVAFGISPFGIWKSGVPDGISGLSAYHTVYADALAWLDAQTIDYLAPQLYWEFGGGQDYGTLVPWWAEKASANTRHLYPGLAAYKTDGATFYDPSQYSAATVPRQVRFNRDEAGVQGEIFFRAANLSRYNSKGLADTLKTDLYRRPALTPTMPWKSTVAPATPQNLSYTRAGPGGEVVALTWDAPPAGAAEAERYALYRVQAPTPPDPATAMQDAENLLAVTGATTYEDRPVQGADPYHYFVTAASANAVESRPSVSVEAEGRSDGGGGSSAPSLKADWERNAAGGNAPSASSDGVAHGTIAADASGTATHERVLLAQRGSGVQILDAGDGTNAGQLDASGITNFLAPNDVEVSDDGVVFACDLATDASSSPFDCYRWDHENDTPTNVISFTTPTAQRLGDHITVVGSVEESTVTLWAPAAGSSTVYRFESTDGGRSFTPTAVTLTGAPTDPAGGYAPDVAPEGPGASGFYYNARFVPVQEYSAGGAFEEEISTSLIDGNTHGTTFFEKGDRDFLLTFNIATKDGTVAEVTDGAKAAYATTPAQGTNSETSGDVAVRDNGDGSYTVYVLATADGLGAYTTTGGALSVDADPPEVTVKEPALLGPPDHQYASVGVSEVVTSVTDALGGEMPVDEVRITSVSSDEAENGEGDGDTTGDIVIAGDFRSVQLRRERRGGGNGRVYTVHLGVSGANGQVGRATYRVEVPHDREGEATDDGPSYTVEGYDFAAPSSQQSASKAAGATQALPQVFSLKGNYPNPFSRQTNLVVNLPEAARVTVEVYDALGRRVQQKRVALTAGSEQRIRIDGSALASGMYLYRVTAETGAGERKVETGRMILVR